MITITKEQAQNRFVLLPPTLQDAVFSEQNAEIISSVGEQYHLPDDKLEGVTSLVGWVLLGFLHIEDLPNEIASDTGIAAQLAKDITSTLNSKIFNLIKSDVDKAYAPVPHEEVQTGSLPAPISLPTKSAYPSISLNKPTTVSDIGWAKQPAATIVPTSAIGGANNAIPTPPRAPVATTTPPSEPAPMMLHEDTTFKPAERNANFTVSRPGTGAEVNMNRSGVPTPPQKAAILEFGSRPATTTPQPPKPTTFGAPTRSYSTFNPSLASTPTGSSGSRNVSQITPTPTPAPATPTPPHPAITPAPTAPIAPTGFNPTTSSSIPVPVAPKIPRIPQVWDIPAKTPQPVASTAPTTISSSIPVPTPPKSPTSPSVAPNYGVPQRPITKDFL